MIVLLYIVPHQVMSSRWYHVAATATRYHAGVSLPFFPNRPNIYIFPYVLGGAVTQNCTCDCGGVNCNSGTLDTLSSACACDCSGVNCGTGTVSNLS